jgi:hypothetical protein
MVNLSHVSFSDVLKGFESTVFAYGQTGTGKTFTLEGDLNDPEQQGVIPRAAQAIFDKLRHPQYTDKRVTVSYLEIYNEELCDLLAEPHEPTTHAAAVMHKRSVPKLDIMEGKNGTFCRGLSKKEVNSAEDVLTLMRNAQLQRHVGETKMNKESSRSHCIFSVNVHANIALKDGTMEFNGKLHMVDLAGSECAKTANMDKPTSADAARERERMNINRSLLTLGRVISMLKEMNDSKKPSSLRIPYRDSKLTRILQESLGGRCKTVIIATLSPSVTAIEESMSTLNYAQAAVGIVNKPVSTSFMSSTPGKAPPAIRNGDDGDKSHENQVEYWHEMECRLQYMQAQVEEAQAALARKHLQQQELQERNEKLQEENLEWETKNHKTEAQISELESSLERETAKREAVEIKLQSTEDELERKNLLLNATQGTEARLTEEASRLLVTLESSVAEGNNLETILQEKLQMEVAKVAATKVLYSDADQLLNESLGSLQSLSTTFSAHYQNISSVSKFLNTQARASISRAMEVVNEIASVTEAASSSVQESVVGKDGLMVKIESARSEVSNCLTSISSTVNDGEEALVKQCQDANEQLREQTILVKSLQAQNKKLSNDSKSSLATSVVEISEKFQNIAKSAQGAIEQANTVRQAAKSEHLKMLKTWNSSSHAASKNISKLASGQVDELQSVLTTYQEDAKVHDTLGNSLTIQEQLITGQGKEHLSNVLSQQSLIASHEQTLSEAQKKNSDLQAACLKNMFDGIKQLVDSQMGQLMTQSASDMATLIQSTQQLKESGNTVDTSANLILQNFVETTEQLRNNVQVSKQSSTNMLSTIQQSSQQFHSVASLSKDHMVDSKHSFAQASSTFNQLSIIDEGNLTTLNEISTVGTLGAEKDACLLSTGITETLSALNRSTQNISSYSLNTVLASSQEVLSSILEPREAIQKKISGEKSSIIQTLEVQEKQLNLFSTAVASSLKESREAVKLKRSEHAKVAGQGMVDLLGNAEAKLGETTQQMRNDENTFRSSSSAKTERIRTHISDFAEYKMKVNEALQELPVKQQYSYSKELSSTPCEADLFRTITPRNATSHHSSMSTIGSPEVDKENDIAANKDPSAEDGGDAASVKSNESLNNSSLSMRSAASACSPPRILQARPPNRNDSNRKPAINRSTSKGFQRPTAGSARAAKKSKRPMSSTRPETTMASSASIGTPTKPKRMRKTGTPLQIRAKYGRPL